MRNRTTLAIGASLILLGVLFFINQILPNTWPLILVAVGVVLLVIAVVARIPGLAVSGVINLVLGGIFLWQASTNNYASWMYVWPLVPGSVGLGLIVAGWLGMPGGKARWFAWIFFLEGLAFTALYAWLHAGNWLTWPLIPAGLGAMFLLAAVLTRAGGLAIPGTILGGVGAILYWQNTSGNWASWSYVWALIPGLVGLGFVLATLFGVRSRGLLVTGLYFIFWALLFFAIFAAFFGSDIAILRYWPVFIILLGGWLLARSLIKRKPAA